MKDKKKLLSKGDILASIGGLMTIVCITLNNDTLQIILAVKGFVLAICGFVLNQKEKKNKSTKP